MIRTINQRRDFGRGRKAVSIMSVTIVKNNFLILHQSPSPQMSLCFFFFKGEYLLNISVSHSVAFLETQYKIPREHLDAFSDGES